MIGQLIVICLAIFVLGGQADNSEFPCRKDGKSIAGNAAMVYRGLEDLNHPIVIEGDCAAVCRSQPTCTGATFTPTGAECVLHNIVGTEYLMNLPGSVYFNLTCGNSNITPTTNYNYNSEAAGK